MPMITWPQAAVLCTALAGTFALAYKGNPALAGFFALFTSVISLYQKPPAPPAGP